MLFKSSVRTSKRTPHFIITKINWLTLFKFNPFEDEEREREERKKKVGVGSERHYI
jgi:hypothetical protein